jgi:hypothetical protein
VHVSSYFPICILRKKTTNHLCSALNLSGVCRKGVHISRHALRPLREAAGTSPDVGLVPLCDENASVV